VWWCYQFCCCACCRPAPATQVRPNAVEESENQQKNAVKPGTTKNPEPTEPDTERRAGTRKPINRTRTDPPPVHPLIRELSDNANIGGVTQALYAMVCGALCPAFNRDPKPWQTAERRCAQQQAIKPAASKPLFMFVCYRRDAAWRALKIVHPGTSGWLMPLLSNHFAAVKRSRFRCRAGTPIDSGLPGGRPSAFRCCCCMRVAQCQRSVCVIQACRMAA